MRFVVALLTASLLCGCTGSMLTREEVAALEDEDLCARLYYSSQYGISASKRNLRILVDEFDRRFQHDGLQPGYCKVLAVRRSTQDRRLQAFATPPHPTHAHAPLPM